MLINSGEIDLLTVHHCKRVGGEILYPCRDSDEDDAIDNIPELAAKLESPMKRPYRISLFGAGSGTEIDAPETAALTLLPEVGQEVARKLSATLEHPEGDIAEVSWQWQRSDDGLPEQPPPPPVSTAGQPEVDRESGSILVWAALALSAVLALGGGGYYFTRIRGRFPSSSGGYYSRVRGR